MEKGELNADNRKEKETQNCRQVGLSVVLVEIIASWGLRPCNGSALRHLQ
jgi:hypothetical protein